MIRKRQLYQDLLEVDIDTHIKIIRRNISWETNLEIMAFTDLMKININILTSLDQITLEFEINHPHNICLNILKKLETLWRITIT